MASSAASIAVGVKDQRTRESPGETFRVRQRSGMSSIKIVSKQHRAKDCEMPAG